MSSDPFSTSHEAAKRAAEKQTRDNAAKQATQAAQGRMKAAKDKAMRNPNDDLGYRYVNQGQGWPWPKP